MELSEDKTCSVRNEFKVEGSCGNLTLVFSFKENENFLIFHNYCFLRSKQTKNHATEIIFYTFVSAIKVEFFPFLVDNVSNVF